jgi:hypothetical protein
MTINGNADELLTTAEAAAILGRNPNTLVKWRIQKPPRGPAIVTVRVAASIRRGVRYRRSDVEAFKRQETLNSHEAEAHTNPSHPARV